MLVRFVCVRVCVLPSEMECVLFYSRKIAHRANVICCIMYPTLNKFYLILSYLIFHIRATQIFTKFGLWGHEVFVKWVIVHQTTLLMLDCLTSYNATQSRETNQFYKDIHLLVPFMSFLLRPAVIVFCGRYNCFMLEVLFSTVLHNLEQDLWSNISYSNNAMKRDLIFFGEKLGSFSLNITSC